MTKRLRYLTMMFVMLSSLNATLIKYFNYSNPIKNNIDVNDDVVIKKLVINIDNIYPGNKNNIDVSLDVKEGFTLFISFEEITKNTLLNDYLIIDINTNKNEISYNLKDVINKGEFKIGRDINELTISYLLSDEADNSTQNQKTSFSTYLIARGI